MRHRAVRQPARDTDTVTIRMRRELRERIRELAERERRSQTAQIELLLEEALRAQ